MNSDLQGMAVGLRLLQLSDSAFPTGAYAFSDGLETLTQNGTVRTTADLSAFLGGQLLHGWGTQDVPACALAWQAAAGSDTAAQLAELDDLLDSLKLVEGPRLASLRVGANLSRAARRLWPEATADLPATRHHAVTFGAAAQRLGAAQAAAVGAYVSSWLLGRATSATRLMKVGGLDAQAAAAACEPQALACIRFALAAGPEDLGGFSPVLDAAAARQATLAERLFQT